MTKRTNPIRTVIGWREWVALPDLKIAHIKAKIDTGARTSALHAADIETFHERGQLKVRFTVHPFQQRSDHIVKCTAKVTDERLFTDSGGHREKRYVIETTLGIGDLFFLVEMSLTNRDTMQFRMLLGRTALKKYAVVHPGRSFLLGHPEMDDLHLKGRSK